MHANIVKRENSTYKRAMDMKWVIEVIKGNLASVLGLRFTQMFFLLNNFADFLKIIQNGSVLLTYSYTTSTMKDCLTKKSCYCHAILTLKTFPYYCVYNPTLYVFSGVVNSLLSLPLFQILGRLVYCHYLVHSTVIQIIEYSRRSSIRFTDLDMVCKYLHIPIGTFLY